MLALTTADAKHLQKNADDDRAAAPSHGAGERSARAWRVRPLRASTVPVAAVDAAAEREAAAFAKHGVRPLRPGSADADTVVAPLAPSRGVPLDPVLRQRFEQTLNADLAPVRIHDDSASHQFAREHGAQAATLGSRIYFGERRYAPNTDPGRQLLAHELVHTLQQSARTTLHRTPETEARLLEIENELASSVIADEYRAQLEAERDQLLQAGNEPGPSPVPSPAASSSATGEAAPPSAGGGASVTGGDVVAAGVFGSPTLGPPEMTPPWMMPTEPISSPPIPGETPFNFTPSSGVPADGVAVGESGLGGVEAAGGAADTLTVGGTALGEGTLVSGGGAALSEGAGAVGASVLSEGTALAGGSVLAEGTAVIGTSVVVGGAEVAAVTGATAATATGVGTAAAVAGTSAWIPVVGWIVAAVIVGGIVIYLVTRDPPRQAPGAPGGTPVSEPGILPAASAPGAGGQAPAQEPGQVTPVAVPGSPSQGPVLASGPLEGAREYGVYDKNGDLITDIDHIENNILWEEKTAVNAPDIAKWVDVNITQKFDAYLRARLRIDPWYAKASIGFRFLYPLKIGFATAIWEEIERLRGEHPDVTIELEIPPER